MLPDDYLRKMKQDIGEAEAQVESKTRYEPDPDFSPPPEDDDWNRDGSSPQRHQDTKQVRTEWCNVVFRDAPPI